MKRLVQYWLALACLWIACLPGWGQTNSASIGDPVKELHTSLAGLDTSPSRLPTGVLLNRMMFMTNPHRYAGQGDTIVSYNGFEQQYWEFYHATVDTTRLVTLDSLRARVRRKRQQHVMPLLLLTYAYNEFSPTAAQDGLITIDSVNALVTDGPDRSRSPYTTGQFFSVVLPGTVAASQASFSLYVGPEFWLGTGPVPDAITLDFGDGAGPRTVAMNSTIEVQVRGEGRPRSTHYTSTSELLWPTLTNGATLTVGIQGSALAAALSFQTQAAASLPPDAALGLLASRNWPTFMPARGVHGPGGKATAIAWIKYANGNTTGKLRRPLVFVEGIDFGFNRQSDKTGEPNYYISHTGFIPLSEFEAPHPGGYRNGGAGWNEVVDYNQEYEVLEKFRGLRDKLQAPATALPGGGTDGDYDLVYLDFSDGATLIEQNAMVLAELLQWISDPANRTPDAQETVVIGASMGGQVSRFALAWMEQQGICHNSKLWVSFDSPNRGANISLGAQYMFWRLSHVAVSIGSIENSVDNALLREASKEMLLFHFSSDAITYRNQWQSWQQSANSYPSLLRRVAIANGSGQAAILPGVYPGMQLLETTGIIGIVAGANFSYALPGAGSHGHDNVIFRYRRPYNFSRDWIYYYCDPNWSYMDYIPGSYRNTTGDAEKESSGQLHANFPSQTFMSVISALDVKDAGSYNSPNLGYNVRNQIPFSSLPNRAKYAFDAYFTADNINEPHIQLTDGQASAQPSSPSFFTNNSDWIQNELRESAHNLPAALTSTTYNYGSPYRHLLPSVTVAYSGEVRLNDGTRPANGGTAATQTPPAAGNFEVYTSGCGTRVRVTQGGHLTVGTSLTYTASLRISNNDLLLVEDATVMVSEGSVLYIPKNGTLVVKGNGQLVLNGRLRVDAQAYVCIENPNNIIIGPTGVLDVDNGARRYANPALNLTGLACQYYPACTASLYLDVHSNHRLAAGAADTLSQPNVGAPGSCTSYPATVTALGTGLDTDFVWLVDGVRRYPGNPNKPNVIGVTLSPYHDPLVEVTVSSVCDGTQLSLSGTIIGSFPGCRLAAPTPVAMYPNPATSALDFEQAASGNAGSDEYEVSLYDGRGARRWHGRSVAGKLHVSCAELTRGIYGVVITQGGTIERRNLSLE